MINNNYALQVVHSKSHNAARVKLDNTTPAVQPISGEKDTVTLSDQALAMLNGTELKQAPPTYVKPQTARSLLAQNDALKTSNDGKPIDEKEVDNRFGEIMQNIIDQRLGVDRKKLEALEALMVEIGENENMSPEEKAQALEKLAEMREKLIEESQKVREVAKQTD